MCDLFGYFWIPIGLVALVLPAAYYRAKLRVDGDDTGRLPLMHPRLMLGGFLWLTYNRDHEFPTSGLVWFGGFFLSTIIIFQFQPILCGA